MGSFTAALVLLILAVIAAILEKTYSYLPARELKRQAEAGKEPAVSLWRAVCYGAALTVLLWIVIVVGLSVGLVLLARVAPPFFAVAAVGLIIILVLAWLPNLRRGSLALKVTLAATPTVVWLLAKSYPLLRQSHRLVRRLADENHTGLFAREDLIEMLQRQKDQPDNRIAEEELNIAMAALEFGDKKVGEVLVPRQSVVTVNAGDKISPKLLDELHKTHHSHFPVYEKKRDNLVGTLRLHDFLENVQRHDGRLVADAMQPQVCYLHENDSLLDALHTFYRRKHQLFIVINSFNEYVGILTVKDMLEELVGQQIVELQDEPANRKDVATRHPKPNAEIEEITSEETEEPSQPKEKSAETA